MAYMLLYKIELPELGLRARQHDPPLALSQAHQKERHRHWPGGATGIGQGGAVLLRLLTRWRAENFLGAGVDSIDAPGVGVQRHAAQAAHL